MGAPGSAARATGFDARRAALAAEAERDAKLPPPVDVEALTPHQLWNRIEDASVPAHHRAAAASVWDVAHAPRWRGKQPRSGGGARVKEPKERAAK